jgi:hypothetical protein
MWDAGEPWYSLTLIAQAMPAAWLGGHLAARRATGAHPRRVTKPRQAACSLRRRRQPAPRD